MGFAETRRLMDYRKPGSQSKQFFLGLEAAFGGSGNPAYPGGQWFNMTGMGTKDEAEMKKLKANEVKNGRLAMIAMLGYCACTLLLLSCRSSAAALWYTDMRSFFAARSRAGGGDAPGPVREPVRAPEQPHRRQLHDQLRRGACPQLPALRQR